MLRKISTLLCLFIVMASSVSSSFASGGSSFKSLFEQSPKFLPVDEAFILETEQKADVLTLNWTITDDYYLYVEKFKFTAENATIVEVVKGQGTQIEDEFLGIVDVYFFQALIKVKLADVGPDAVLKATFQGCAKAGLCYQPVTKTISLEPVAEGSTASVIAADLQSSGLDQAPKTQQNQLAESLQNGSIWWTLLIFFGLGVGLAFTPCVFPMFPILSSIIAGQQNMTVKKGLYLSFIYVQGMALTYSLLGLVVASLGVQFQAALQHPVVLIVVSLIFVVLAGAMFGWFTIQMPQSVTSKLAAVSNKQKSGNVAGVFLMGLLSGLIASPCTTAPLTGALLYVAQSGDLFIGFITLYILSLGMGLPLLVIGASGGSLLPKAGNWMNVVKNVFGFIMLAIPLILLERILDASWIIMMAGGLLLIFSAYMHSQYLQTSSPNVKSGFWLVSLLSLFLGSVLLFKPLLPAANNNLAVVDEENSKHGLNFKQVVTLTDINAEVAKAAANGQSVMLDFYADWCVACKEFEVLVFNDKQVQQQLSNVILLQVDMTENSDNDIEIMEHFQILGLPTIMFFNDKGIELTRQRVTGFMGAEEFLDHLTNVL